MNKNLRNFLPILLALIPFFAVGQKLTCTTHEETEKILKQFPERRALLEQLDREAALYTAQYYGKRDATLKVIPTVIHVIHNNGGENISKASILSALEQVNLELSGSNNTNSVIPEFQSIIGNTGFELRLAKIDQNGQCTDGITRTVSSLTVGAGENVKDLVNWNDGNRKYLQVWLVASVGSGAGGYTYLPGSTGAHSNGIIIRTAQFQQSLAHEFGHWMNLSHVWGPTNEPGEPVNCSYDDDVFDTPNTMGTSNACNLYKEDCGTLDNVQNHMDYSSCARMFTLGQAARMQAASNSSIGARSSYWANANRTSTGTNDGFSNSCVPNIAFFPKTVMGCEGISVSFEDASFGADLDPSWTWSWNFAGGSPATSSDQNPTVTYNVAGSYNVSLTISNNAGSDVKTIQNAVVVTHAGGGILGAFSEGMEDAAFPNNAASERTWSLESTGGPMWQRSEQVAATGNASARINLRSAVAGSVNNLISPPLDMTNVAVTDAKMTFKYAHSNRSTTDHNERLRIYVSSDCGQTWKLRFNKSGNSLNTAGGLVSGIYTPTASQWSEESVSLGIMAGEKHVLVKFEATSDNQSYLYLDDININPNASNVGIQEAGAITDMRVLPNPISSTSVLEISMKQEMTATIVLMDVLGKTLNTGQQHLSMGLNRISLPSDYSALKAGIYLIQVRSEQGVRTVRFVKG